MFLDFDDDAPESDRTQSMLKYLQFKEFGNVYFAEEDALLILDELSSDTDKLQEALDFITYITPYFSNSSELKIKKADILISLDTSYAEDALIELNSIPVYDKNDIDFYLIKFETYVILGYALVEIKELFREAKTVLDDHDFLELVQEMVKVFEYYDDAADLRFYAVELLLNTMKNISKDVLEDFTTNLQLYVEGVENYSYVGAICDRIIQIDPYNKDAWICKAILCMREKKYQEAIDAYLYAFAINQNEIEILLAVALCYSKINHTKKAIEYLHDYLALNHYDTEAYHRLGLCYAKEKNYMLAIYYLNAGLELSPTDNTIRLDIAQTYLEQKDFANALQVLRKALVFGGEHSVTHIHFLIALCAAELKQYHESIKYYLLALTEKKSKKEYWEGLLKVLVYTHNYEQLHELSLQALYYTKKNYFLYYLAFAEYKQGQHSAAAHTVEKALLLTPKKYKKLQLLLSLDQVKKITKN